MKVVKSLDIVNDYIEKLEKENKQLQQAKDKLQNDYQEARDRIDELISKIYKATEYIKERFEINEYGEYYFTHTFDNSNMKELLEILGDKENE